MTTGMLPTGPSTDPQVPRIDMNAGLQPSARSPRLALAIGWGVGLAALLGIELLALTFRFDSQALVDGGGLVARAVGYARYLPQVVVVMAAAGLLFGGASRGKADAPTRRGLVALLAPPRDRHSWRQAGAWLAAHLVAFAGLAVLTGAVWEGSLGRSPRAVLWFAVWFALGSLSVVFWALALLPWPTWRGAARSAWSSGVLPATAAVALGACILGRATGDLWLWTPLYTFTLRSVRVLLGLIFRDVAFDPATALVGARGFEVEVAPACAGYEGIGLVWVFLGAYLGIFRKELRFPQALWLLPLGTLVIWGANVLRIVSLITLGATLSPEVALGGFHSQAGWLSFNAVALGLVAISRRGHLFQKDEIVAAGEIIPDDVTDRSVNPTAAYLGPLLALVGVVMVMTLLSPGSGFDALYPARVLGVGLVLWWLRRGYHGLRWTWSWSAVAVGVGVYVLWIALEPAYRNPGADPSATADALDRLPKGLALLWLAFRVFGSVVTVPIAEELAFRGYLTRRLIAPDFTTVTPGRLTPASLLISSLLFGLMHGRWLAGTLAGVAYAWAYRRRGELADPVLAHGITNALIAAQVLVTGSWSLWS